MVKEIKVRREVQLFRDAVGKLISLLTSRSIKVTETGRDAYCEWNEKGELVKINLPSIPDDASDRLLFAMQGFVDHEVAHVLYTDPMVTKTLSGKGAHHVWNVVEDIYIEKRMSAVFLGSRRNLYKVHAHILESTFEPETRKKLLASRDDSTLFLTWFLMPACRAESGHPAYREFMEEYWSLFPRQKACLEKVRFAERINVAKNSKDCVVLAVDLLKALKEDMSSADSPEEPKDHGGKKAIVRPGTGTESSPPADLSEFDEIEYDPTPADGTHDEETNGGDEDDVPEMGEDDSSTETPAEPTDEDGDDEDSDESYPDREMTEEDLKELASSEEIDTVGVESAATKIISDEVRDIGPDTYLPYSRSYDFAGYLEDVSEFIGRNAAPEWRNVAPHQYIFSNKVGLSYFRSVIEPQITGKLSTLAKEMERAVVSKNRTQFIPGQRRGRLHGPSLYRLSIQDDRVFRKREETQALNACVQIIIDLSGSMSGGKIALASACGWALSDALDKIRVPNIITGFTTFGEMKPGGKYHRVEPLLLPILKGWDERANSEIVRARCGFITNYRLANNVDGESLLALTHHMTPRKEDRKIIMLLSDGEPAALGYGHASHLKEVAKYVEKTLGYDLLGVGIQTSAPAKFYSHSVKIDRASELPETVAVALRRILIDGQF